MIPMNYSDIKYEVADRILTITLHRPDKLNAYTRRMQEELIDAFGRADADDESARSSLPAPAAHSAPGRTCRQARPLSTTRAGRDRSTSTATAAAS
jgi:hypothetical protein